jgi:hypothetical protein
LPAPKHGESIKAAALHVKMSLTYAYEFFKKPVVQAKLRELRDKYEQVIQETANQCIGTRQFVDEDMASIVADPQARPSDRIAAARLLAEMGGFDRSKPQVQQPTFVTAQILQADTPSPDVYTPEIDRRRQGIHDGRSIEIEQRLLGASES